MMCTAASDALSARIIGLAPFLAFSNLGRLASVAAPFTVGGLKQTHEKHRQGRRESCMRSPLEHRVFGIVRGAEEVRDTEVPPASRASEKGAGRRPNLKQRNIL